MSTTPPDETTRMEGTPEGTGGTGGAGGMGGTGGTTGGRGTPYPIGVFGDARMPIPGNAEFLLYLASLLLAAIVTWAADDLGTGAWLDFFQWVTIAYLLSRGIAKASRVLEH